MRSLLAISFLLFCAGTAFGQSRHTICLHAASEGVCKEAQRVFEERRKRIEKIEDQKRRSACLDRAAQRFARDCAQSFITPPNSNRECHRIMKGQEGGVRLAPLTRTGARDCEAALGGR